MKLKGLVMTLFLSAPVQPAPVQAADEIHFTYLGQTEVGFFWRGAETYIEYGTASGVYTGSTSCVTPFPLPVSHAGPFCEARISGLVDNTAYFYRFGGAGPEYRFKTPPPRGSSGFWFAEQADVGSSLEYVGVAPTQVAIASDQSPPGYDVPEFVLVAGDLTYANAAGHIYAEVDQHFNDVMVWSTFAAYMPAWGNHDWDGPNDDLREYEGRFILPGVTKEAADRDSIPCVAPLTQGQCQGPYDDWSWFDYGNVRFISYPEPYDESIGNMMTGWLLSADTLMDQAEADPLIRFIVTFGHRPAYSSGNHTGSSTLKTRLRALNAGGSFGVSAHPKYVLNLNGHSHNYERFDTTDASGVLHITGASGNSCQNFTVGAPDSAFSVYRLKQTHNLKVFVSANRIDGYAICGPAGATNCTDPCTPGEVIDSWSITSPLTVSVDESPRTRSMPPGTFDIQGRRAQADRPGVYVVGGKKVPVWKPKP